MPRNLKPHSPWPPFRKTCEPAPLPRRASVVLAGQFSEGVQHRCSLWVGLLVRRLRTATKVFARQASLLYLFLAQVARADEIIEALHLGPLLVILDGVHQ